MQSPDNRKKIQFTDQWKPEKNMQIALLPGLPSTPAFPPVFLWLPLPPISYLCCQHQLPRVHSIQQLQGGAHHGGQAQGVTAPGQAGRLHEKQGMGEMAMKARRGDHWGTVLGTDQGTEHLAGWRAGEGQGLC